MNPEQARRILNISENDDKATIKKKYRRLMSACHPDAAGSDGPEYIRRAQEINAAYSVLKKDAGIPVRKKEKKAWQGEVNEKAFCDRNIYLYYSMDVSGERLHYQAARGKYMWNPDDEEFELFLISIRHASKELLEKEEEGIRETLGHDAFFETEEFQLEKFQFQAQLFQSLSMQFIHPAATLRKIAKPIDVDGQGREIYRFRAFLGAGGQQKAVRAMAGLKAGDVLYPEAFRGNKITVSSREKVSLGHLSLEDDKLYFCVIPLLTRRLAQVKMTVKKVETGKRTKPWKPKAEVDFYFRVEKDADGYTGSGQNLEVVDIIRKYDRFLRNRGR